ncbi:programmed cell death protein 2-like [Cucumis melo var. makuwa]|uniref:Programmed cell death protein 2-like n=1 Tax=Cucumis melo var. makuwa TaxID=1194695 RepID=A0A5D3BTF5_CUCMM|nr:programmed cell death protein 2-like [Cucumis melo var. makuwa]
MGAVILGLPGPWADDNLELSDYYTTKVGGIPDLAFKKFNHSLLDCSQCGSSCAFLKIYAPVSIDRTNIDERLLLVFGCLTPECGSSSLGWRVFRVQKSCDKEFSKVSQEIGPLTTSTSAAKTNWWQQLDEESDEEMDLAELQKAFSEVATKVSHAKGTPSESHSKTVTKSLTSRPTRVVDVKTPEHKLGKGTEETFDINFRETLNPVYFFLELSLELGATPYLREWAVHLEIQVYPTMMMPYEVPSVIVVVPDVSDASCFELAMEERN